MVFLTFSSNKRWWRLRASSFLGRRSRESLVVLPLKGRLRQLATPLGIVFRELGLLGEAEEAHTDEDMTDLLGYLGEGGATRSRSPHL